MTSLVPAGIHEDRIFTSEVSYELDIPDQLIKFNMTKVSQNELKVTVEVEEHIAQIVEQVVVVTANQLDDRPVDTVNLYPHQLNTTTGLWESSMTIYSTTPRYLYTKSATLLYGNGFTSQLTFDESRYKSASIDLGSEYNSGDLYLGIPSIEAINFTQTEYNTSLETVSYEIAIETPSGMTYPVEFAGFNIYVTILYPDSGITQRIETGYSGGIWHDNVNPEDYWGTSIELIEVEIPDISGQNYVYTAGQNFTKPSAILNNTYHDSTAPVLNSITAPSSVEVGQEISVIVNATENMTEEFRGEVFLQYGDQFYDDVGLFYFNFENSTTLTIHTRDGMTSPISFVNITLRDEANNIVLYDSSNFTMPSIELSGSTPDRTAPVFDDVSWVTQDSWDDPLARLNISIPDEDLRVVFFNETVIIDGEKHNFHNRISGGFPSYGVLINYWIWAELLQLNIFPTEIVLEKIGLTDDLRNQRMFENGVDFNLDPLVVEYPDNWKVGEDTRTISSTTSTTPETTSRITSEDTTSTTSAPVTNESEITTSQLLSLMWVVIPVSIIITAHIVRRSRSKPMR